MKMDIHMSALFQNIIHRYICAMNRMINASSFLYVKGKQWSR